MYNETFETTIDKKCLKGTQQGSIGYLDPC